MKTFSILLLTVMIAIFAEKYMAKYLLVEIDQPEGEVNPKEDNGSRSILRSISARATCSAKRVKFATEIMESCPGYKVLEKVSNPIGAKDRCCEWTTHDSECGKSFFVNHFIGKCVCEKKGHDCIRTPGFHIEYRFGDESEETGRILGAGICNQEDKEIWNSNGKEAQKALDSCGTSCWGGAECTDKCMMKKTELSTKCANCFGSFAGCGKSNCTWKCMFGRTQGCINCVKEYCADGFVKCSGLSSPM